MQLGLMQRLQAKQAGPFAAASQAAGVGLLLESLRSGEPVVVLAGAAGSGKSHVLEMVLDQLGDAGPRVLHLQSPFPPPLGVQRRLEAMLDLSDATPPQIAQALLLLPGSDAGAAPIAVVLDGAEAAPVSLLQYLWLMHTLTCLGRPTLQLVLVGRDALWQGLNVPALAGLRAGVTMRMATQAYSAAESQAFVAHLLRQRGCWLEPAAVHEIVTAGAGMPGSMLALAEAACSRVQIDRQPISRSSVMAELGIPPREPLPAPPTPMPRGRGRLHPVGMSLAIAAVVLLAVVGWQIAARRVPATAPPAAAEVRPTAAVSAEQIRLEIAGLQQPSGLWPADADWPMHRALPALRPPPAAAVPAGRNPARVAAPASQRATPSAPLLVMADATAPKLSVLFAPGDARAQARARQAAQTLRQSGLTVPEPLPAMRARARAAVGYFFAADRDSAEAISRQLARSGMPAPVQPLDMPPSPPPPGSIRVLLGSR